MGGAINIQATGKLAGKTIHFLVHCYQ